MHSRSKVKRHM